MKNGVSHIIFDLGGVLLNIDLGKITTGFAGIMHTSKENTEKVKNEIIPAYETGKITTEEFLSLLEVFLKPGFCRKDITDIWNSIILDMPKERLELLKRLRKDHRVHLLSNINDLHATCFENRFRTWYNEEPRNYFDHFFYSHQIGRRKPDISTYEWVLEQLGADPEETVFIDDMPENIEGARSVGIKAYQLQNNKTDVLALMNELGFTRA